MDTQQASNARISFGQYVNQIYSPGGQQLHKELQECNDTLTLTDVHKYP